MFSVTPIAIEKIKEEIQPYINRGEELFIRVSMGIGWGGPQLKLTLEESALSNDTVIEQGGLKFLIQDNGYFDNATLDFVKTFFGGGEFKIVGI